MANHVVTHVEIPAKDLKAASEFYASLFDWKMFFDEKLDYYMYQADNQSGGGFTRVDESSSEFGRKPGQVVVYVTTDDMDATLAKAQSLGATVTVPKMEIPEMGWLATFVDPTGNHIGLWQGMQKG
jgi:uncharacterized protein